MRGSGLFRLSFYRPCGLSHGPFEIPASINTAIDCRKRNIVMIPPVSNTFCNAIKCDKNIVSLVPRLFLYGCPSAIIGLIVAIIVDTVKRVCWGWLSPHILKKKCKASSPSVAHANPSPAIADIVRSGLGITSPHHFSPSAILCCPDSLRGFLMRCCSAYQFFCTQTPAALCVAIKQLAPNHYRALRALAQADPLRLMELIVLSTRKDGQPAKLLAC